MHRLKQFSRVAITSLVLLIVLTSITPPETTSFASAYTNPYGTISYDSGTNTLTWTGNSSDNDAWKFYDFWYWANIDPGTYPDIVKSPDSNATHEGTQYTFYCKLQCGDGSTSTYFKDTNKHIVFDYSPSAKAEKIIYVKENATFTLGILEDASQKTTSGGCSIVFYAVGYWTYLIYNEGETNLYSCSFTGSSKDTFIYSSNTTKLYNSISYKVKPRGMIDIFNIILSDAYLFAIQGNMENMDIMESAWTGVRFQGDSSPYTSIQNANLINCVSDILMVTPETNYSIIDSTSTNNPLIIKWYFASDTQRQYALFEKNTFDPIITDTNGTPIENALVQLCYNGSLVFEEYTNSTGHIPPQQIVYRKYEGDPSIPLNTYSTLSVITTYSSYHLIITKAGYATYETNLTIDHPVIDDAFVLGSDLQAEIYNYLQQKWGNYNASQFWNYILQIDNNITQINNSVSYIKNKIDNVIIPKLDLIYDNVTSNNALLNTINNTITSKWGTYTAGDLYTSSYNTFLIASYINTTRWGTYTFSDVMSKWGTYTASSLYGISEQAMNIANYINTTRWNTKTAQDLYDISNQAKTVADQIYAKWGTYNASDLYDISYDIWILSKKINETTTNINSTVNSILAKWGSYTADQLYNKINDCYNIMYYINNTVWGGVLANDILQQATQARQFAEYINNTRWGSYTAQDIINQWGAYTASDIFNIANQTKQIANYINITRWGTVYASDLDKWGAYTASDLYSMSEQAKNLAVYINNTRWGSYTAQQLYDLSNQIESIADYINTTRWSGFTFNDIMSKWGTYTAEDLFNLANYTNSTVNSILSKWGSYTAEDIINKWGSYTATDLYNLIGQTRDIADYINTTRWGSYQMQDLMNKWGAYTASDLYSLVNQTKNVADYLNNSVWNGYNASYITSIIQDTKAVADFINNSRWGTINASQLYDISNTIYGIVDNIENIVLNVNTTVINISDWKWYYVYMSNFGEIVVGDKYKCYITVYDKDGYLANATINPTVTIYDASGNIVVNNAPTTQQGTGVYYYEYSTTSGQPTGQWTAIATTNIDGRTAENIDYFEVEGSPPEVTLSVSDNTITDIKLNIGITNEGDTAQEYTYYYWIAPRPDAQFTDPDVIDGGSASKLIDPHDKFTTTVTLTVENTGEYWAKVAVYYGTSVSSASAKFNAVKPSAPPSGGGGGGGVTTKHKEITEEQVMPSVSEGRGLSKSQWVALVFIIMLSVAVFMILVAYYNDDDREIKLKMKMRSKLY